MDARVNEEEIGDYCKQFVDFMQVQLHRRYDLISSRKRLREPDQEEGVSPQDTFIAPEKGNGKLDPDTPKVKYSLTQGGGRSKEGIEEKPLTLVKPTYQKQREQIESGSMEKGQSIFNLQRELEKVKILVPLIELLKKPTYKAQVSQFMLPSTSSPSHGCLNLQEERPMVIFGPHVEELDPSTRPFYMTLVIHDLLLHNRMLDSGASHNLMPLIVREKIGLQIMRPYKDLCSFNSKRVKFLGMIKALVVNLDHIPVNSVVMDIVIDDILA